MPQPAVLTSPVCTCRANYEAEVESLEANVDEKYRIAGTYQTCCVNAVYGCPVHGAAARGKDRQQICNEYRDRGGRG